MTSINNFTVETGKTILRDIIKTVNQADNTKKLSEAKNLAGKEMIAIMQYVFPIVMKIQQDVIKNYGFSSSRGLVQFAQIIREMEKEDPEIQRLRNEIRSIYLPPIIINNDVLI